MDRLQNLKRNLRPHPSRSAPFTSPYAFHLGPFTHLTSLKPIPYNLDDPQRGKEIPIPRWRRMSGRHELYRCNCRALFSPIFTLSHHSILFVQSGKAMGSPIASASGEVRGGFVHCIFLELGRGSRQSRNPRGRFWVNMLVRGVGGGVESVPSEYGRLAKGNSDTVVVVPFLLARDTILPKDK